MEILLEENPRMRRRRRYNPLALDELGNPIEIGGYFNPRRRHSVRRRKLFRNPTIPVVGQYMQGVDMMDVVGAGAGLVATTFVPGLVVKTTDTTGKKLLKLGVSAATAIGVGMVGRAVSPKVGKAALMGGIAGTAVQALGLAGLNIGGEGMGRKLISSPNARRVGSQEVVSPSFTREGETVSLITP